MQFLFLILIQSFILISSAIATDEIPENFARIRIWDSDFSNHQVGHVSLETKQSYISFWPDSSHESATSFNISLPQKPDFSPIHEAPGVAVASYDIDLDLEKKNGIYVYPQNIYDIRLNTDKIDMAWNFIKNLGQSDENNNILFNFMKWYAPGQEGIVESTESNGNYLRFNCASMVLLALRIGGLEEIYLNAAISDQKFWEGLAKTLGFFLKESNGGQQSEELGLFLEQNSKLSHITFPRHINLILQNKIKGDLRLDLPNFIPRSSIIPQIDYELTLSAIGDEISLLKSQSYKMNFIKFISQTNIVTYQNNNFYLSASIVDRVKNVEQNRLLALGAVSLAAASYVGVKTYKGECALM